jgi:hypothetical protein
MNRIFNCTGIPLFRVKRWRLELWIAPRGAEILDHTHGRLDAWLTLLWGCMIWRRADRCQLMVGPKRPIRVNRGVVHGASARTFSLFLTLEHWVPGAEITSAARDLQLA